MAYQNKTAETSVNVNDFIASYADTPQKKADSLMLAELMQRWSGYAPKMWGPTIIGFGKYHYRYPSGHEGEAPLLGFSPRKAEISLYVYVPTEANAVLLNDLGKFRMGKSCIYIKQLSDIDTAALEKIARSSMAHIRLEYGGDDPVS